MSMPQKILKPPPRSESGIRKVQFIATSGLAVTVVVAIVAALVGASASVVAIVVMIAAALSLMVTHRFASTERLLWKQYREEELQELATWQDRWQRVQRETQEAMSALSRMRDGVIMLSGDTEILLINPAARRLLGIREELDLTFRPIAEVVRIPELTRAIAAANAGDGIQKLVVEVSHEQRVRPIKIRVDRFSVTGHNNLLVTLRDETESRRVEEMRREFIANISHELKTPLAAIKGYAETVELAIADDPDAAVHFMNQIQTQCLRLERLIADMMQLARAQSGGGHLLITSVSLVSPIRETMKTYCPIAEAKNVDLQFVPPDVPPLVQADAEALLTITNNLVGNAIRYTPSGGSVRVSCRDAGTCWALLVEDTGVGITESDQKRIFERFYRVEKSRSSGDGGTGIGLSIVKNLAIALGGEVRVSSQIGQGAKFEVLLLKAEPNPESSAVQAAG